MGDTKEYIKGDKHVHQAGSIMIKFAQYNVPEQKGGWKQQEEKRWWTKRLRTMSLR